MAVNIYRKLYEFYKEHSNPRYYYVERYMNNLEFSKSMSKEDRAMIDAIRDHADVELKAVKNFHIISIFLYVAIYFSIISFLLADFLIIGEFVKTVGSFIALIGTPVFIALQFAVIRFRNIRYEKLSLYVVHLISYSAKKYPKP